MAWHTDKVTNGSAESMNNHIKKVKRAGHESRNLANHRITVLLSTGPPEWSPAAMITPR